MECKTNKSEVRMGGGGGGSTKRVGLFTKEFANKTLSLLKGENYLFFLTRDPQRKCN
jgi:hypothetical protein